MAKNETRRLKPSDLVDDEQIYNALKSITGYAPSNSDYSVASVGTSYTEWKAAQEAEAQAAAVWAAKRDDVVAKSWAFHNKILGAKNQIRAQFGEDSNEVQAVKLKKKSEYKSKTPKPKPPQPPA